MSEFYVVSDCPVCPGSSELFALLSRSNRSLLFYCPSCDTAWDKIPEQADEIQSLEFFAPEGVEKASIADLNFNGVKKYRRSGLYESLEDLLD